VQLTVSYSNELSQVAAVSGVPEQVLENAAATVSQSVMVVPRERTPDENKSIIVLKAIIFFICYEFMIFIKLFYYY
jgi:hypothetical protein